MNEFTIWCTEEQTHKALELGATLEFIPMFRYGDNSLPKFVHKNKWGIDEFYYCPTAEQMIGWAEGKEILIDVEMRTGIAYVYDRLNKVSIKTIHIPSRTEATLAAIDAALAYLNWNTNNKKRL